MINIAEEHRGDVTIMDVDGRVDSNSAKPFEERLTGLFKSGRNRVVIDFKDIVYISSAGCRVLVLAGHMAETSQGKLALCNLTAEVMRVLELGGLADLFAIYPSREEGLAKLS